MQHSYDFGMIGLGVMGRNFLLNVADNGFSAAGLDLDAGKVRLLDQESEGKPVRGTTDVGEFAAWLKPPRRIMLLVPAGKVVDSVIDDLLPQLSEGDLIIDGGNSHFPDTERRLRTLAEKNIRFLGVGVSGGAEGARRGPSIMPGGAFKSYKLVQPILEAVAAKVDGEPCVAYMGDGSAGHYVKMVHNGIEYGLMQLIAEAYDLLHRVAGAGNDEIHQVFRSWNEGRLNAFLIEITADIFTQRDDLGGGYLIDVILDKAKQKGTGKWTSQSAMDLGIPIPTIDAAVSMRGISSFKKDRKNAGATFIDSTRTPPSFDRKAFIKDLEAALYFSFVVTYAQGLHLLAEASQELNYGLKLSEIASIWRGGCIIRAGLLEDVRRTFQEEKDLRNLIYSRKFRPHLIHALPAATDLVQSGTALGVPLLAFSSALHYFRSMYAADLPLNLVQAQRDYFGSHTYERKDRDGIFHTAWNRP